MAYAVGIVLAVIVGAWLFIQFVNVMCAWDHGCLWHPGFRRYSDAVLLICSDIELNPEKYKRDRYTFWGRGFVLWAGNGWPFLRDHDSPFQSAQWRFGPLSVFDKLLLWRTIENWETTRGAQRAKEAIAA